MRLIDCKPKWVLPMGWCVAVPYYIGLTFYCPHCPVDADPSGPNRRRRLAVGFWPHIDPTNIAATFVVPFQDIDNHRRVSGETFETLTLEPSIGFDSIGHWHGRITNGECQP